MLEHVAGALRSFCCSRICTGPTDRRSISSPTSRTRSSGRRVLVVATYRSDAVAPEHALHRLGAGLRRAGSTVMVELGPLADEDVEALVTASVDEALPAELTAAVCARAEGNPFFALELSPAAASGEHRPPAGAA